MEVRGQLHAPAALTPENKPGSHCVGGVLVPTVGLEVLEKRKISCICRYSKPIQQNLLPNHYTD